MTTQTTGKQATVSGKEEGEISVSDDEVQLMQTSTRTPLTEHVSVPLANTNIQRRQAGKGGSLPKPADPTALKLTHPGGRIIAKNQVAPITAIHSKKFPVRDNNNLVINFSDDDNGSDSDGKGRTQTSNIQSKVTMPGKANPSISLQPKLKGPRPIVNRAITKKSLSTRTFTHAAPSRVSNLSIAKETKSNKNTHTIERVVSKDTQHPEQIVKSNRHKLQDLSQQIALLESELKLKAAQPKKDAVNPKIRPAGRVSIISDDTRQLEPNEPATKRLKVSENDTSQPVLDYRMPASAVSPVNVPDICKSLQPAVNANASCKQIRSNSDEIAPPVISQPTVEGNISSSVLQKSSGKENHYKGGRELETMNNVDRSVSSDQLLKIVNGNQQPCLNNSGLWNIPGSTTAPRHSQLDILSLTNLEDSLDKELEEAQERKRLCEIEERNALKVYRKAQRSLIEANARCADLYSKREILSAHYGSLIVNNSRLLWPSRQGENSEAGFHF